MYRVLARKYRPQTFDDLIGQEVLVRTLTNAFASGRIAHAFILTGIRGIGKTTTARIIARGLNCVGADGNGEPTTTPCGVCPNCIAIAEGRHVDVIEMDAASNTGVDNMRDLIDSVQYAPVSARYKVYIVDEVHMLSKSAFNAILKTLEEPPPHVKFIFATTELRKIPVTIISRCQKFDLKRVEMDELAKHLVDVAKRENIALEGDCALLIAAAAEGSVRDALSILDQTIAMHTDETGVVRITPASLREMLGLADKTQSFGLLNALFTGEVEAALATAQKLHHQGADAAALVSDLLTITHYLTRIVVAPVLASNVNFSPAEQALAKEMAARLTIPRLTRTWQILSKGAEELRHAALAATTLEMVLVRLAHASSLPTPADLVRALQQAPSAVRGSSSATGSPLPSGEAEKRSSRFSGEGDFAPVETRPHPDLQPTASRGVWANPTSPDGRGAQASRPEPALSAATARKLEPVSVVEVHSYLDVVKLFEEKREPVLASHLTNDLRLVRFALGKVELKPATHLSADVAARIQRRLIEWTGERWSVLFTTEAESEPTLREQRAKAFEQERDYAFAHPNVRAVLEVFPDAKLVEFSPSKI